MDRDLEWDGCFNVRDLGGLRTRDGRTTRRGAVVRADDVSELSPRGWEALRQHGVRTILDLRNDDERRAWRARPGLETVHVPLDDVADTELWDEIRRGRLDGSPLYFRLFLDRKPAQCAAAVRAVARAAPGGVVVHCGGGRDRTGLVALLLLALVDVEPDEIVADYERSNERLPAAWAARGRHDERPLIDEALARHRTTARALLLDLLGSLDAEAYLRDAGVSAADLAALRERLV